MPTVFVSCGEPSGDLYAGALAESPPRARPRRARDRLRRRPARGGRGDARRRLPRPRGHRARRSASRAAAVAGDVPSARPGGARANRPDVFVAIDFPDFNFRLAAAMRRLGVPIVYYIPPQLWAWRSGRMKTLKALADRILVIFPFEPEIYREGRDAGDVRRPPARRTRARVHASPRPSWRASASTRPGRSSRCCPAAARTRCTRSCRRSSSRCPASRRRCPACSSCWPAPRASATPLLAPLAASAVPIAVVEGRSDDVLASRAGRDHRVGHRDGAGGHPRVPDGDRLPGGAAVVRRSAGGSCTWTRSAW